MDHISAIIITQNEERNISRCLESLKDVADEIIVVDSGSSDATQSICLNAGARFLHHDWEGYDQSRAEEYLELAYRQTVHYMSNFRVWSYTTFSS